MSLESVVILRAEVSDVMKFLFLQGKNYKRNPWMYYANVRRQVPVLLKCEKVAWRFCGTEFNNGLQGLQRCQLLKFFIVFTSPSWPIVESRSKAAADRKCVGFIIHEQLYMQKLSGKRVPRYLNADQKWYWVNTSKLILQHSKRFGDFWNDKALLMKQNYATIMVVEFWN